MNLFTGCDVFCLRSFLLTVKNDTPSIEIGVSPILKTSNNKVNIQPDVLGNFIEQPLIYDNIASFKSTHKGKSYLRLSSIKTIGSIYIINDANIQEKAIENIYNTLMSYSKKIKVTLTFTLSASDCKRTGIEQKYYHQDSLDLFSLILDQSNIGFELGVL